MAAAKGTSGATNPIVEEFEPFCKWQREEACDTLIIHLPEFKKEQLRVHINNRGILKVSGDRSIDASRRSKFYKEVTVPKNCNTSGIQAKFTASQLFIILPKLPADTAAPEEQSKSQQGSGKGEVAPPLAPPAQGGGGMEMVPKGTGSGSRGKGVAKAAVNAGMVLALMAVIMAFVAYMYKSTVVED